MEYDLLIREAEAQDATELIALLDQIGHESSFTSLDENGIAMTESEMQRFINKQAQSSGSIRRLQLTVQKRNLAAVHLYRKLSFIIEGQQERGACIEGGEFLDVYLMGRLIDK